MGEWLLSKAFGSAIRRILTVAVSYLAALGADKILADMGIKIDWAQFQVYLTGVTFMVLDMFRNFLKVKVGYKWLALVLGFSLMGTIARADDSAYFKLGPLSLDIPFKTVSVVYMYDFKQNLNLVGGETPLLTVWDRVEGTAGVVTSLDGAGAPFIGGNLLIGNVLEKIVTLPPEFKIGGYGGYDFRTNVPIFGLKASIQLWK